MDDAGKTVAGMLFGFGGYWMLSTSGVPFEALVVTFTWAVAIMAVGWVAGRICANSFDCDSIPIQTVNWAQLVTWVFPPLGLFLSMATYQMADGSMSNEWKFRFLSLVGGLAAIVNAGIGLLTSARPVMA
jgi:hypothetical protein